MRRLYLITSIILLLCQTASADWKYNPFTSELDRVLSEAEVNALESDPLSWHVVSAPDNPSATGSLGDIAQDGSYIYIVVAPNTWERVAIDTWIATNYFLLAEGGVDFILQEDGSSLIILE